VEGEKRKRVGGRRGEKGKRRGEGRSRLLEALLHVWLDQEAQNLSACNQVSFLLLSLARLCTTERPDKVAKLFEIENLSLVRRFHRDKVLQVVRNTFLLEWRVGRGGRKPGSVFLYLKFPWFKC